MIKLNNKNITYVALADSNNSLKAPKEIWYADSNNSVKLVYRRKDALIEGEDYEKYHWLVGDGTAYIDTNIIYLDGVVDLIAMVEGEIGKIGREKLNNSSDFYSRFVISINPSNGLAIVFSSNQADAYITQPLVLQIDVQNDSLTINGTVKSLDFIPNTKANSIYLFAVNRFNNPFISSQSIIKISKFSISSKINLIPCKLLKPLPKWLDANGIRRQVGECGMIDLVSGKFYGNVNSVGTFTVENYYERKEWLVGDGSAYIDTLTALSDSDTVEMKITGGTIPSASQAYKLIFGNNTNSYNYNTWVLFVGSLIAIRPTKTSSADEYRFQISTSQELTIFQSTTSITVNGTEVWSGTSAYTEIADKCTLFAAGTNVSHCYDGKVAYLRIPNKLNMIPCTLTMDLPASMDANNIARTKGTSGMWDLVSDKFYGNVANSGTFKAVNLAEGVDYEVHQWLRTEVNTKATLMTLDINSYSFSFSRKPLSGSNVPYFITEGLDVYLYSDSDNTIRIWNRSQYGYYYSNTPFNWGDTISITSSSNSLVVNSQSIPQNTFPVHLIYFGANDTNGTEHYTSSITVDGIERYIPVKLLRPIPSKYDANGIARQAGECGMYDTVNDKFYGNVASSGSFSCVNDS